MFLLVPLLLLLLFSIFHIPFVYSCILGFSNIWSLYNFCLLMLPNIVMHILLHTHTYIFISLLFSQVLLYFDGNAWTVLFVVEPWTRTCTRMFEMFEECVRVGALIVESLYMPIVVSPLENKLHGKHTITENIRIVLTIVRLKCRYFLMQPLQVVKSF